MKKKLLCCLSISLLSANTFALEIHGGHVISEKQWSTGSAKFTFTTANAKQTLESAPSNNLTVPNGELSATAHLMPITADAGTAVSLTGDANVRARNNTSTVQTYNITSNVCVNFSQQDRTCGVYQVSVALDPQGYISQNIQGNAKFYVSASGQVLTTTNFTTIGNQTYTKQMSGVASSYINVL